MTTIMDAQQQQQHRQLTIPQQLQSSEQWTHVQFETSIGSFVVELYYKHTPRSCYNLAALAHAGYYDGTIFHRVIRDFMIQGGDPTGTGRGGESIYGGKFEDELTRNLKFTGAGVVAMANASSPNTNGSQFFITLRPTPWLDNKHSILGRIYRGMGVIQRMGMVATQPGDPERPIHPITIHKATAHVGPPPLPGEDGDNDDDEDANLKEAYEEDEERRPIASRYF